MIDRLLKIFITCFFVLVFVLNFSVNGEQQFSHLANSFINGKLYFIEMPITWNDTAFFQGRYYWPLAPLPAVALLPFVFLFGLFNQLFLQGYMQFFLVIGVFYLIYKLCRKIGYASNDALFWSFTFTFGSSFLGVALWSWSWYFSQVITVFLLFWTLYEFLGKKRYFLIGIIIGLILLTRLTASFVVFLFILDLILDKNKVLQEKIHNFSELIIPIGTAFVLALMYNYFRFANPYEFGYGLQIIPDYAVKAREMGVFGLIHLPGNLYYFLLSPPLPVFRDTLSAVLKFPFVAANPWGMSVFFTSPYFIYLFFFNYKGKLLNMLWITSAIIAVPIFMYYGIGYRQYGYRYALDFLPLLFMILLIAYRKKFKNVTSGFKFGVIAFSLINFYLFITLFL